SRLRTTASSPISIRRSRSWRPSSARPGGDNPFSPVPLRGDGAGKGRWHLGETRHIDRQKSMIEVKERTKSRSDNTALHIRKIGVIGAGQMGGGIAHVSALAGFDVKLNDVSPDRVKAGIATINGNMARQVSRKRITEEERQAALKRITLAESYEAFADCDLVI